MGVYPTGNIVQDLIMVIDFAFYKVLLPTVEELIHGLPACFLLLISCLDRQVNRVNYR